MPDPCLECYGAGYVIVDDGGGDSHEEPCVCATDEEWEWFNMSEAERSMERQYRREGSP